MDHLVNLKIGNSQISGPWPVRWFRAATDRHYGGVYYTGAHFQLFGHWVPLDASINITIAYEEG